ncbi:MAG: dolichyl-diphosphooligosaccharide---protein glycosyltransferase [Candidatus Argoarchaeum ethanivorans]|uniref:dolichyl-phosphooligosaccharide-protein glycotransferase n=1 Tax=Candidatus Argoarchaeum ethanivorans TaxID=2608793 RepID=A0A8B3S1A8_9EURY|nr:MAG: dolichyl-diphosphooligosaccharide---protein glycosyltransferase [Candidatus Argoarchaeum ethanivorans]
MTVKKDKENKHGKAGKGNNAIKKESLNRKKPISKQIEQQTEIKQTLINRLKSGAFYGVLLAIIFAIALYIRTVLPYDSVFLVDGTIRFGGNDPWYHMRLVDYLLHNYPHTLTYDAFTEFPYGHFQHYGPLYDHIIGFLSLILGLGHPDQHLVNSIGAYFPAVLGALVVIPVYFVGKHLHNRGTGLLAALIIATLPGQFLSRSLLGFVDHHVTEALFSTATILFFMLAIRSARAQNLSFSDLNKDWQTVKYPLIYSILTGLAYAAYQLCWTGAILFGLIIMLSAIIIYVVEHIHGNSTEYITVVGVIAFALEALLILPFIHPESGFSGNYSWLHVTTSIIAIIVFVLMYIVSKEMNRRDLNQYYYPAALVAGAVIGFVLLSVLTPHLISTIKGSIIAIFTIRGGGAATVAEISSMLMRGTPPHLDIGRGSMVYGNFGNCFYVSILGIILLGYYVIRRWKPEDILVLVWTLFMLLAIYGQNRFGYYYAVNVALLSAYFATKMLGFAGFDDIQTVYKESVNKLKDIPQFIIKDVKIWHVLFVIITFAILVYPLGPCTAALQQAKHSGGPSTPWYNSLEWMRYNTPDPGISYYGPYERPPKGEPYPYPDTAYGVMSWWDYGFWIETIGRRIPNANPFQGGIGGGKEQRPGAATFLTAESEDEANKIADELGVRYVVSDVEMATGKFYAIAAWDGVTGQEYWQKYWQSVQTSGGMQNLPSMTYYSSMEARLHTLDGIGLKHYRLVHESMPGYDAGYRQVYNLYTKMYPDFYEVYPNFPKKIPEENTGYVKIFEYVKGARITGSAPLNSTVTLQVPILTNKGRTFEYAQTTTASNGTFTFIVPYSTDGAAVNGTNFDTAPSDLYAITIEGRVHRVPVSEGDVMNANIVEVV